MATPTVKTEDSEPIKYATESSKMPQKSTVPAFGQYSAPEPYQESAYPDGISTKQDTDSTPSQEGKRDGVELMSQLQQNQIQMKLQSDQAAAERKHFDQQRAAYEQRLSTFETEKHVGMLVVVWFIHMKLPTPVSQSNTYTVYVM